MHKQLGENFTERLRTWAVLTVFPSVLLLISVVDMLRPAKLYSSYENRKLQQKPELTVQAVRTGSYMKEYEDYVSDQILGRNRYIAIKSATDRALGKKEINGVYLATDGTLIEKHTEEFSAQNIEKTLEGLQKLERLLQGKSRSFQVLLAPTADNVYSEKLPAYAEVFPEEALWRQFRDACGKNTVFPDVFSPLRSHAEEYIYYGTDHHWTTLGSYYAYQTWAAENNVTAVSYNTDKVSDTFHGTLRTLP